MDQNVSNTINVSCQSLEQLKNKLLKMQLAHAPYSLIKLWNDIIIQWPCKNILFE